MSRSSYFIYELYILNCIFFSVIWLIKKGSYYAFYNAKKPVPISEQALSLFLSEIRIIIGLTHYYVQQALCLIGSVTFLRRYGG